MTENLAIWYKLECSFGVTKISQEIGRSIISPNNPPIKILASPQSLILPVVSNPEVTADSFDRVVVCDRPKIAQLLR